MDWRQMIRDIGGSKVAKGMGKGYPTIRRYIAPGSRTMPKGMMKPLCDEMIKHLNPDQFEEFKRSMQEDLFR